MKAITTSDETVDFGRAYCVSLGKTTVLSRDRAGFIVNTLLIPYLNDAVRMLEDGFAPPPLLKRMVTAGHLGRKSGRGFYDYE